ncbi:hydrogen peroxide-inducible genes activator [Corynebacterium sp. HS2168-gen11]|uniref:hydrogen peroxide-inducible genes activator n=1 Tax=Corynebacterium sp. HS2168-gen11 TaxID=2974027 RepID=UPI00216AEA75|nr:hydrogen peroxide-inducible genes activator [Corynebacterium sp. HS2168-gen11]MCS4535241.1 hydrogen peroxide-inducible genes activator [Corynebacterium sp. HS2168-gen11]
MSNKEYRPTLAQLRTFVTIAENKHFGTAAAKLNISQPSLSQALVALETGLDVQLIERSTRRVIITPAGEKLLPLAKATLNAADSFLTHAQGASGTLAGSLTVGMIPTIAPYLLPEIIAILREEYPDLTFNIIEDQTKHLITALRDGAIDCALIALPANASGLNEVPLYTEDFVMAMPPQHALAGRTDLTLNNLRDVRLLLLDDGHCLRDQVVDLCRQAEFNPILRADAGTRASSLTTVLELIRADMGATLIPESAHATESERMGLATATFAPDTTASRQVGIVFRSSSTRGDDFKLFGDVVVRSFHKVVGRPE